MSTPITSVKYTGDGSTATFAIPFPYLNRSDVLVTVDGVPTTSFVWTSASIIALSPTPPNGSTIIIKRETLDDAIISNFAPGTLKRSELLRAFTQFLYLFQEKQATSLIANIPSASNTPTYVPGSSSGPLAYQDGDDNWFQVDTSHGVWADWFKQGGDTSDAQCIQRAHDALSNGGIVYLSARTYNIGTAGVPEQVTISKPVRVIGMGSNEVAGTGTVLSMNNAAVSGLKFTGSGAKGSGLFRVAIKQPQGTPSLGWAPVAYPPAVDISSVAGSVWLDDILLCPVYEFVKAVDSGRLWATNIRGEVFRRGYYGDKSYDCDRLLNWHIWSYWSAQFTNLQQSYVCAWSAANCDVIHLNRVDTPFISDIFAINVNSAVRFSNAGNGCCSRFEIKGLHADGSRIAVWVDGTASNVVGQIGHIDGQHIDNAAVWQGAPNDTSLNNSYTVLFDTGSVGCIIQIDQIRSEFAKAGVLYNRGTYNTAIVSNMVADRWGTTGGTEPAFYNAVSGTGQILINRLVTNFLRSSVFVGSNDYIRVVRLSGGTEEVLTSAGVGRWIAFTPTLSTSTGSLTSASAGGRYLQVGKTVWFTVSATIVTNGTGAGVLRCTLPVGAAYAASDGSGRERSINGKGLNVSIDASQTTAIITNYDNTYPGANGAVLQFSGVYEVA